jgi:hypothetical protein
VYDSYYEGTELHVIDNVIPSNTNSDAACLSQAIGLLVVAGRVLAAELTDGKVLETFSGSTLTVHVAAGVTTITGPINTVTVTRTDIMDCNSVVHLTDSALLPLVRPSNLYNLFMWHLQCSDCDCECD